MLSLVEPLPLTMWTFTPVIVRSVPETLSGAVLACKAATCALSVATWAARLALGVSADAECPEVNEITPTAAKKPTARVSRILIFEKSIFIVRV